MVQMLVTQPSPVQVVVALQVQAAVENFMVVVVLRELIILVAKLAVMAQSVSFGPAQLAASHQLVQETCKCLISQELGQRVSRCKPVGPAHGLLLPVRLRLVQLLRVQQLARL
jgi:hypothetical protein